MPAFKQYKHLALLTKAVLDFRQPLWQASNFIDNT